MNLRLGKKPARVGSIQLRFGAYFTALNLPVPAVKIGNPGLIHQWGMLANDRVGDCVWAGAAHETMLLEAEAGSLIATFTSVNVLSDYSACTGFVQNDASTDQGTDVADAAKYRQKTGIVDLTGNRHKIDIYASLRAGDVSQLALAVDLLGTVGVGVELPSNAEEQFNYGEPWDVSGTPSVVGGHYIPCVGRNSQGHFLFVTWGRLQAATPRWVMTFMDEGVAYISRERLSAKGLSPQGFNLAKLEDDYRQVTS